MNYRLAFCRNRLAWITGSVLWLASCRESQSPGDGDGGVSGGSGAAGSTGGRRDAGIKGSGGVRDARDAGVSESGGTGTRSDGGRAGSGGTGPDRDGSVAGGGSPAGGTGGVVGAGGAISTCTSNTLQVAFNPMYSAYVDDPALTFQLPAMVTSVSGAVVEWSASDPSMVKLEPSGSGVMLTMLKAGDVTIQASTGSECGTAPLHITAATKADWQAGRNRYDNMNPLPALATDPNTGLPVLPPGGFKQGDLDPPDHPPACTNCHADRTPSSLFEAGLPTPQQFGGFSDNELASIFTRGEIPPAAYFDGSIVPRQIWTLFHQYSDITGDDVKGMVTYLRSVPPKPAHPSGGPPDAG